jgi:hypothetical protein
LYDKSRVDQELIGGRVSGVGFFRNFDDKLYRVFALFTSLLLEDIPDLLVDLNQPGEKLLLVCIPFIEDKNLLHLYLTILATKYWNGFEGT